MAEVILIAEDDPQIVELVKIILETKQYDIHWAKDGQEAIDETRRLKPDLILLDIMMPKLNGYEVMHLLKEDIELKGIPAIFLTAKGQTDDKVIGLKMGSHDYISKPFDIYELIARVEAALRIKNEQGPFRKTERRIVDLSLADPLTGLYNRPYFLERLEEEIRRAYKYTYPIACLLMEIDNYQEVQKKFGKLQVDQMIQQVAILFKNNNRVVDIIGRYGEDQFIAVLTQTDGGGAFAFGERLKENVHRSHLVASDPQYQITVSLGVASFKIKDDKKVQRLLSAAEKALQKAKEKGGNNIMTAE